jgi:hypothetical protein
MVNTNGYAKSCTMSARSASAIRSNAPSTRLVIRSVRARMLRALNTGIIRWRSLVWSGGSMFSTEWSSTDWKSSPPPDLRSSGPDRACPRHGLSCRHCPLRHPDRRMVVRRSFTGPTCDFHGIVEDWTDTGDQAMGRLPFSPRTPGQLARPSEGVARQRVHWHLNVQSLLHIRVSEIVMLLQWRRYLGSCWGITWPERDPRPCLPPCRGWGMGQARVRKGQI